MEPDAENPGVEFDPAKTLAEPPAPRAALPFVIEEGAHAGGRKKLQHGRKLLGAATSLAKILGTIIYNMFRPFDARGRVNHMIEAAKFPTPSYRGCGAAGRVSPTRWQQSPCGAEERKRPTSRSYRRN
jgi:hypothetical protein